MDAANSCGPQTGWAGRIVKNRDPSDVNRNKNQKNDTTWMNYFWMNPVIWTVLFGEACVGWPRSREVFPSGGANTVYWHALLILWCRVWVSGSCRPRRFPSAKLEASIVLNVSPLHFRSALGKLLQLIVEQILQHFFWSIWLKSGLGNEKTCCG